MAMSITKSREAGSMVAERAERARKRLRQVARNGQVRPGDKSHLTIPGATKVTDASEAMANKKLGSRSQQLEIPTSVPGQTMPPKSPIMPGIQRSQQLEIPSSVPGQTMPPSPVIKPGIQGYIPRLQSKMDELRKPAVPGAGQAGEQQQLVIPGATPPQSRLRAAKEAVAPGPVFTINGEQVTHSEFVPNSDYDVPTYTDANGDIWAIDAQGKVQKLPAKPTGTFQIGVLGNTVNGDQFKYDATSGQWTYTDSMSGVTYGINDDGILTPLSADADDPEPEVDDPEPEVDEEPPPSSWPENSRKQLLQAGYTDAEIAALEKYAVDENGVYDPGKALEWLENNPPGTTDTDDPEPEGNVATGTWAGFPMRREGQSATDPALTFAQLNWLYDKAVELGHATQTGDDRGTFKWTNEEMSITEFFNKVRYETDNPGESYEDYLAANPDPLEGNTGETADSPLKWVGHYTSSDSMEVGKWYKHFLYDVISLLSPDEAMDDKNKLAIELGYRQFEDGKWVWKNENLTEEEFYKRVARNKRNQLIVFQPLQDAEGYKEMFLEWMQEGYLTPEQVRMLRTKVGDLSPTDGGLGSGTGPDPIYKSDYEIPTPRDVNKIVRGDGATPQVEIPGVNLPGYTPPAPAGAPNPPPLDVPTPGTLPVNPGEAGTPTQLTPGPTAPINLDIPGVDAPSLGQPERTAFDTSGLPSSLEQQTQDELSRIIREQDYGVTNPLERQTHDELSRIIREQDYGTPQSVQDSLFQRALEDIDEAMDPIYDRVKLDAIHRNTFWGDENTAGQFGVANEQSRRVRQARVDMANQEAIRAAAHRGEILGMAGQSSSQKAVRDAGQRGDILGKAGQLSQSQRQLAQQLVTDRANFQQRNSQMQQQAELDRAKIEQQENEFSRLFTLQGAELAQRENEYLRRYSIDTATFNQREAELNRRYGLDRAALTERMNENIRRFGLEKAALTQRQTEMIWDVTLKQAEQSQRDRQMQLEQQRAQALLQQRENEYVRDLNLRQREAENRDLLTDEALERGAHDRQMDEERLKQEGQRIQIMDKAANNALANNIFNGLLDVGVKLVKA